MTIIKNYEVCDYCKYKKEFYKCLDNQEVICENCINDPLIFLEPINHCNLFDKPGIYSNNNLSLEVETPLSGFILQFDIYGEYININIHGYGDQELTINKFDILTNYSNIMGNIIENTLESLARECGVTDY